MEQIKKDKIITHRLHSIQFTDEAIENLKWNKNTDPTVPIYTSNYIKIFNIKYNFKINIYLGWVE